MYQIKRILVGLDLSDLDKTLISYCNLLTELFPLDKIYFIHVAKTLELPDETKQRFPDLLAPMDESIKKQIEAKVTSYYTPTRSVPYEILVSEGSPTEKIIKWSGIKEIDLMVMGRKYSLKGSGILPGKLTKVMHCSLLYIPENYAAQCNKILVPVDFSKNSAAALHMAMESSKNREIELLSLNSYEVPTGYHTTGKTFDEFADIMKGHAEHDYDRFLSDMGLTREQVPVILKLDDNFDPVDNTINTAIEIGAQMIMLASKGRSSMANFILGSFAEKMTIKNSQIPLFIFKNKNDNLNFFEALLKV